MSYTNEDIARYDLSRTGILLPTQVDGVDDDGNLPDGFTVADAIVGCCSVGYGGHYWEPLEEEEHVLYLIAREIAPAHDMSLEDMTSALVGLRGNYGSWLAAVAPIGFTNWETSRFNSCESKSQLDNCPKCGRRIKDTDEVGCEAPDGQRWCIDHALEELARLRRRADAS